MAKILVSTKRMQGQRRNDFCWVPEGEIVGFTGECDDDGIDGSCGCRRSFTGLECGKGTTTVEVAYCPQFGPKRLARMIFTRMEADGWVRGLGEDEARQMAEADAKELLRLASAWPPGQVVEKRGDLLRGRFGR